MKCPQCGNEIAQGEVFCGQCGTPVAATPVNSSPRSGLLRAYSRSLAPAESDNSSPSTPSQGLNAHASDPSIPLPGPHQQTDFYHSATEAMPPVRQDVLPHTNYHQPSPPPASPAPYPAPGQFGSQPSAQAHPFQSGNDNGSHRPYATGYPYNNSTPGIPAPLQRQPANPVILAVCATIVVLLLATVTITTFILANRSSVIVATLKQTTISRPSPTLVPSPTPSPTVAPSPTPSPTVVPTPAPDAGFAWCGSNCSQYGFMTEFPTGWSGSPATNSPGVQFTNPALTTADAAFKAPGATGANPNDVLMNDLQTNFAAKPGYAQPTPPPAANATIGGAPWYAVATTFNDEQNQQVHLEVYATVYQGKAYIIELQAPNGSNQFDSIKQQYFVNMLVKYQFLPAAQ